MAAGNNFKRFEIGQEVLIERGKNKGTRGIVAHFDEETGRVGIEKEGGTVQFAANGVVNWDRGQAYDPTEFEVEEPAVEPAFQDYARDPELIEAMAEEAHAQEQFEATLEITENESGITVEPVVKKAPAPKKVAKPCQCFCGEMASPGRMFVSGHDQRHKGNLIVAMQDGSEEAEDELRRRGWRSENEILQLKAKGSGRKKVTEEEMDAARALIDAIPV